MIEFVALLEDEIRIWVDEIAATKDARTAWSPISEPVARGEPDVLLHLARALVQERDRFSTAASSWVREQVLDEIERVLALTPGLRNAAVLARVLRVPRAGAGRGPRDEKARARFAASLLASAQDRTILLTMLEEIGKDPSSEELLACWLQEAIVRGEQFGEEKDAADLWRRLRTKGHALAVLPLDLDEVEVALRGYVPRYELHTPRALPPRRPSRPPRRPRLVHDRDVEVLTHDEVRDPECLLPIAAAVTGWKEASNGRFEARVFSFGRRCLEGDVSVEFLEGLGVASICGQAGPDPAALLSISLPRALNILFAASANGGAYGGARRGAYGRLDAWTSVAGLAGEQLANGFDRVVRAAESSSWLEIDTGAHTWFDHVAWDLGLVVLRPDGHTLAMLSATDSD